MSCPAATGDTVAVMVWTDPARRRTEKLPPPAALISRPVHPLPARVTAPTRTAPRTATRSVPSGFVTVLFTTLTVGSPWGFETLHELSGALPHTDNPVGIATAMLDAMLLGLSWLRWGNLGTTELPSTYLLAQNIQVALFLLILLVLLRRLAAGVAPPQAYRFLGALGATVVAAALAMIGGAVAHMAVDTGVYVGSAMRGELLTELARALLCGLVVGLLLAVVSIQRSRWRPAFPGLEEGN
ncbi:hypothetical protein [Micromonospora lutea]|nr:hypothetical protein [Micromonospora lutea]